MDIVLGVSMAPPAVQLVLLEGENADGVTVEQDDFTVPAGDDGAQAATDRVVSAILGTRQSAQEGGYRLASAGVTVTGQAQAALLREALTDHRVENVMLVSGFLAAAALAQAVGGAVGYARTALLYVEPDAATVAVVESSDGSITEAQRRPLANDDDAALTQLTALAAGVDRLESHPDGVFLVGSGTNVAMIKPAVEAATSLAVSAPEEPETALARGAALASAHAPLFASSTQAVAWARDPGTGAVDQDLAGLSYAYVSAAPGDYDLTLGEGALAYSAVGDDDDALTTVLNVSEQRRIPYLLAGSAMATLLVIGLVALVISLAANIRPAADLRPNAGGNVVVPAQQAPATPRAQPPAPPAAPPAPPPSAAPPPPPKVVIPEPAPQQPVHPTPVYTPPPAPAYTPPTPAYTPPPEPKYTPPPAAPAAPPPPPAAPAPPPPPALPPMPPMTIKLRLPFVTIPIPINPPPPPPSAP